MDPASVPIRGLPLDTPPGDAAVPVVPYERMPAELQDRLAPQVDRLGYLGAFFGLAAHQPAALQAFVGFTEALKHALPFRLTEAVALTVASATRNGYELQQHLRLCRTRGMDEAWIAAVLDGDVGVLTAGEVLAGRLARACSSGHSGTAELAGLIEEVGARVAVGVLLLVGRYVAHSTVSRAFGLRPPFAAEQTTMEGTS